MKPEYSRRVERVSFKPVPTDGELKTLSYIALNEPASQRKIARLGEAYRRLKRLEKLNIITRRDKRRTKIVTTTDYFADYLGLSRNITVMKRQLKNILRKMGENPKKLTLFRRLHDSIEPFRHETFETSMIIPLRKI